MERWGVGFCLFSLLTAASCGNQHSAPVQASAPPPVVNGARTEGLAPEILKQPHFALQIGAFQNRAYAMALAERLVDQHQLDVLVTPTETGGKTLYRVRILVGTKSDAQALAASFGRNGQTWIAGLP